MGCRYRYITFWNGSEGSEQHYVEDDFLGGIDALEANNVWAVGENGNNYFFDGISWRKLDNNFTNGTFYSTGISVLDSNSIWVCGNTDLNSHGKIFYFDGIEWIEQFNTDGYHIQAISAYDNEHVWAVGSGGKIYFYDGASWFVQADFGSDTTFLDVDVVADKFVWAAGSRAVDVDQFPYFELRGVIYTIIPEPASFLIVFVSLAGLSLFKLLRRKS